MRHEGKIEVAVAIDFIDRHQRALFHLARHHGVGAGARKHQAKRDAGLSHQRGFFIREAFSSKEALSSIEASSSSYSSSRRISHRKTINLSPNLLVANWRYALRAFCAAPAQKRGRRLID